MESQTAPYRLGFIGAGKLAGSVIRGLVRAKIYSAKEIIAGEPSPEARAALENEAGIFVTAANAEVAEKAEIIFVVVKPGIVLPVLRELAPLLKDKCVISLAAAVRIASMEKIADARFMRALTNTPAAICKAGTAIARATPSTTADSEMARTICSAMGVVVEVNEKQIDAATALAGSGPAFVYKVIEALAEGGKKSGLSAKAAMTLAPQTVLGAAQLEIESGKSPDKLIKMVVTRGETTAAGLAEMERMNTSES